MKFKLLTDLELQVLRDAILSDIIVKMEIISDCDKTLEYTSMPARITQLLTRKLGCQNRLYTLRQLLAQIKTDIQVRGLRTEAETEQTDTTK